MGQILGKEMKKAMAENQQAMLIAQKEMQMQQAKKVKAMQLAKGKEMFAWYSAFLGIVFPGLIIQIVKQKNKAFMVPMLPLGFIWLYQYDLFYGNKLERIRKEARRLLEEENDKFELP